MSSVIADIQNEVEKISVLLVDDQAIVAERVRRMLAVDPTIVFHHTSDANQATELAQRICPTVILQDLVMPEADGLELLKEYRSNPVLREVPVIVLSTKEEPTVKEAAFQRGANDYLVKLPDQIEMLARVRLHSGAYIYQWRLKKAFRALEASQEELKAKNAELTSLNAKLEELSRYKSEFFANMNHEIRTPLVGVLGMAEMLSDTGLTAHQQELLDVIRSGSENLLRIINDILDLSKIESGKLELESIPFCLEDAIGQTMDLLAPIAFGKGLEVSAWTDSRLPKIVVGDVTRLRQILLNLLNNAIKFTAGGEIYLHVEGSSEGASLVHFCLEDTGIGIPADKLDRLFHSFSQVDPSMTRRFGGTGLGLAICRNLTSLMGGRIWVESTVGKGTRFHFVVPLPAASSGADETILRSCGPGLAFVRSPRLVRLLSMWADELSLQLVVRNDLPPNLGSTQLDYLIVDADHYQNEIQQVSQIKAARLLFLNRSRNTGKLAVQYPGASLLLLPLTKRRFLEAIGASAGNTVAHRQPDTVSPTDDRLSGLSVLVADDNPVNRLVCVRQLQKLGVKTIAEVEDGRQTIEAAQGQVVDLILMDVHMPGIDGLTATQQIRLLVPKARQPRIIGLTANTLSGERERCLAAGMDDQLSKPVGLPELKSALLAAAATIKPLRA
jgi:signal transduction histidine kinase